MKNPGMGDLSGIFKQAQKIQKDMAKLQDDLKERVVEGRAGGDMVVAAVNGAQEVIAVKLSEQALKEDKEFLEDLIVAAVNNGLKAAHDLSQSEMSKLTGGLNLPGMM